MILGETVKIMHSTNHGFTLIELLIVVAIIAILAAIAVPNFLEAQARSKVSRALADMRSLGVAIETYRVDHNQYPLANGEEGEVIMPYPSGGPEFFETRMSQNVTTPVAYITSLIQEPFPQQQGTKNPQFHYGTRVYAFAHGGPGELDEFKDYVNLLFGQPGITEYYLLSHGPDLDHDIGHDHEGDDTVVYNPTNGTISSGDLPYFGPGTGIMNR